MSAAPVFREAALRQQALAPNATEGLVLVSTGARVATATALAVCLAGLLAAILISIPVTLDGRGIMLERSGVGAITADTAGRIVKLNITEGARVKAGEVVAEIAQDNLAEQTEDARAALAAAEQERTRSLETMARTRDALAAHDQIRRAAGERLIAIETDNLARLKKRYAANQKLAGEGFLSPSNLIDSEQEIIASRRRIDELRQPMENALVERRTREAEDSQRQLELDLRVADAQRRLLDMEGTLQRARQVTSPDSGIIAGLRVARGDVVGPETEIATVAAPDAADGPLLAYSFIPAEVGTQIRPGMTARVVPTTVKPEEYGYIIARVKEVSTLPVGAEEMMRLLRNRVLAESLAREGANVQATLELERAPTPSGYRWSSSQGPDMKFNHGTELNARVEVRHERLATIALPWLKHVLK